MHGRSTLERATQGRDASILAWLAGVGLSATMAAPAMALPRDHHPWIGGRIPAAFPMETVVVNDGNPSLGRFWSAERAFPDGTLVRLVVVDHEPGWRARTIEFTLADGRRLGPVPIDPEASSWYSTISMGNLDEDPDPEFVLVRDTGGNGSVIPYCLEVLDPLGAPSARSRPLSVQRIRGLGCSADDIIDLDGDGHPEILTADLVMAEPDQTFEGRRRSFVAFRPFRLEAGVFRDVSDEELGSVGPWPFVMRYRRDSTGRTTEIRPEAMDDVIASGRFVRTPRPAPPIAAPAMTPAPARQLDEVFAELGVRGSIIILPASHEPTFGGWEHDAIENDRRSPPAGSFAPFHTAIALKVGAIEDLDERFVWDGTDHGRPQWNRDLTVREAAAVSAEWVFRRIAARTPLTSYADLLAREGFGDGPPRPTAAAAERRSDSFWLDGDLVVSPREQVAVMQRCVAPLDVGMRATRGDADRWIMRSATGRTPTAVLDPSGVRAIDGWHVGWVERAGGERVCFATRLRLDGEASERAHRSTLESVTLACLRAVGVVPRD